MTPWCKQLGDHIPIAVILHKGVIEMTDSYKITIEKVVGR
ncbi:MAG: hypothetical protein JWN52_5608 [Actinomycetia bacterium]|nr:hypothetical protein [Actinomycetes bacterium]